MRGSRRDEPEIQAARPMPYGTATRRDMGYTLALHGSRTGNRPQRFPTECGGGHLEHGLVVHRHRCAILTQVLKMVGIGPHAPDAIDAVVVLDRGRGVLCVGRPSLWKIVADSIPTLAVGGPGTYDDHWRKRRCWAGPFNERKIMPGRYLDLTAGTRS